MAKFPSFVSGTAKVAWAVHAYALRELRPRKNWVLCLNISSEVLPWVQGPYGGFIFFH